MADALCGPVNPLQSFQKHSQIDRTLQQDRLTGPRYSPAQGFRTPDSRIGSLDAEFAAFESGPLDPLQFDQQFRQHHFQAPPSPAVSNWAADFQKLHVSNHPLPSHQFRTEAPLVRSHVGGWQNEFLRQQQNGASSVAQGKKAEVSGQINGPVWTGQNGSYLDQMGPAMYQHSQLPFSNPVHDLQQNQYLNGDGMQLSDADFEQAFSEAFQQAQQMELPQESLEQAAEAEAQRFFAHEKLLHSDGTYTNDHLSEQDTINHDRPLELIRIGSDAIPYTEQQDRTSDQDTRDADDLARTAGQLLNSVQHDSSNKFKESQFLALMRKIRDREVEVQGEDFKTVTTGDTLNPHQPNDFTFPDLNVVYNPNHGDSTMTEPEYHFDTHETQSDTPRSQIQELHPGGPQYPEQSPPPGDAMMSGAVDIDSLASRYQRPSVEVAENFA